MSKWTWIVEAESLQRADLRILSALAEGRGEWHGEARPLSRSLLQKLMQDGRVRSAAKPLGANSPLLPGAKVEIDLPEPRKLEASAEDLPFDVLYDDEHLLVVNKPPGLTVHPSDSQPEGTLVNALLHRIASGRLRALSGIGGVLRPGIVHRIDKHTSGALVITKTDEAHTKLADTFAEHRIERVYWALCYGSPAAGKATGTIESTIGRNPTDRKKMAMNVKDGRRAVTHYQRIEEYGTGTAKPFASFLEARLETGRTHQIRVHFTGLGHSLLGDAVYGAASRNHSKWLALPSPVREAVETLSGQALHARVLGFIHPITGEKMHFEAAPPASFAHLLETLKLYK